jgi:hypothetical protein
MSNRERWVIYPLLIWALGMGFRSQYDYLFERTNLECRTIRIVDEKGDLRLRLSADSIEGGRVVLVGAEGAPSYVLQEKGGLVSATEDRKN